MEVGTPDREPRESAPFPQAYPTPGVAAAEVAELLGRAACLLLALAGEAPTEPPGTDDTEGRTSLADVDLFPGVLARAAAVEDRAGHPFAFYQRIGFEVVGVIPDANGPGKPDILMAKRVRPHS